MMQPLESAEKARSRRRYDGATSQDPYHVNFLPSESAREQPVSRLFDLIVTALVIAIATDYAVGRVQTQATEYATAM
jgi:hypothetical protein